MPSSSMQTDSLIEAESSLTDRYQTTVPESVRRVLKLDKRDKIHYRVKPNGEVVMERAAPDDAEDPVFEPFLALLARDLEKKPGSIRSFSLDTVHRVQALTRDVVVNLDDELSPDDE